MFKYFPSLKINAPNDETISRACIISSDSPLFPILHTPRYNKQAARTLCSTLFDGLAFIIPDILDCPIEKLIKDL